MKLASDSPVARKKGSELAYPAKCEETKQVARTGPDRLLFLQRQREFDRLVEICSQKLQKHPHNDKALLVRASAYLKSGAFAILQAFLSFEASCVAISLKCHSMRKRLTDFTWRTVCVASSHLHSTLCCR